MAKKNFTFQDFAQHSHELSARNQAAIKGGYLKVIKVPYADQRGETTKSWDGIDIRFDSPTGPFRPVRVRAVYTPE